MTVDADWLTDLAKIITVGMERVTEATICYGLSSFEQSEKMDAIARKYRSKLGNRS